MLKVWKKSWEPFGSCLLNSTANPAHFHPSWAGLVVLFSRQLPNSSHDFFQIFSRYSYDYFMKNPQTTITLPFLTQYISAVGDVESVLQQKRRLLFLSLFASSNFKMRLQLFFYHSNWLFAFWETLTNFLFTKGQIISEGNLFVLNFRQRNIFISKLTPKISEWSWSIYLKEQCSMTSQF